MATTPERVAASSCRCPREGARDRGGRGARLRQTMRAVGQTRQRRRRGGRGHPTTIATRVVPAASPCHCAWLPALHTRLHAESPDAGMSRKSSKGSTHSKHTEPERLRDHMPQPPLPGHPPKVTRQRLLAVRDGAVVDECGATASGCGVALGGPLDGGVLQMAGGGSNRGEKGPKRIWEGKAHLDLH